MPHYLTFGIRIPAALADFFSSIAFVRVTKEQQLGKQLISFLPLEHSWTKYYGEKEVSRQTFTALISKSSSHPYLSRGLVPSDAILSI